MSWLKQYLSDMRGLFLASDAPRFPPPPCNGDRERLDWLTRHISGKALREAGVIWPAWSPEAAREAIDAAMKEDQRD